MVDFKINDQVAGLSGQVEHDTNRYDPHWCIDTHYKISTLLQDCEAGPLLHAERGYACFYDSHPFSLPSFEPDRIYQDRLYDSGHWGLWI